MSFTPATDDVEVFLRDLQECVKQLNYDDQVVMTTIRAANATRDLWNPVQDDRPE